MNRVRTGELPWMNIDSLHRLILDDLLERHQVTGLSEVDKQELNRVWHRLNPWPDVSSGLGRLRQHAIVASLSNGNVALLVNMARHGGAVLGLCSFGRAGQALQAGPGSVPDGAALLGLEPRQVLMVAAHNGDLKASKAVGFRTAFVHRPREHGPEQTSDLAPDPSVDVVAKDFNDLAVRLGIQ